MGPLHLALSPAVLTLGDLRFLPVLLGWISPTPYSRFFSPARCISSSRPVGFFPSHSVIFLPTCSSSSLRRVLMSLRNGVDMSAVLVLTWTPLFIFPHPLGRPVSEILAITGHISSFIGGSLLYPADHVPGDLFILLRPHSSAFLNPVSNILPSIQNDNHTADCCLKATT